MNDSPTGNEPPAFPGQQPEPTPQPYLGQTPQVPEGQQYPPPTPQAPYGAGMPPNHPQATASLVMGVASLVLVLFCALPLGPIAWIMGSKAVKEIDANPTMWSGRSNANTGRILGIVATCLFVLAVLAFVGFVVALGIAESGNANFDPDF